MQQETICKTIHQYSKIPISAEDMGKLQEIAEDCRKVKNYVYDRFGGIGGLPKLYPGYTVQNEMTRSGLRSELDLPSVYFYLAVFDAVGEIKSQWTRTKDKVLEQIGKNEEFSDEEKHYLRFLIKVNNAFTAILNQDEIKLPGEIKKSYDRLAEVVDVEKMHRYLCRKVRKYHVKLHTDKADGFSLAERAYRYGDHGIYISMKEKRKRIFIALTDNNQYKRQIYIKLYPEKKHIEIKVPVNVAIKAHDDYTSCIGVSMGVYTMLTTHEGHIYGEKLGQYQTEYADWMRIQTGSYSRNRRNNPGRKKYENKKRCYTEALHSYINHELNRFLKEEKPQTIYMVKLPKPQASGASRGTNNFVTMWQRGYIRKRLEQKCREQSVELAEVLGKNISSECSQCGAEGNKLKGIFSCKACGYSAEEKMNTARNVLKRGMEGKILN